MIVAWLRKWWWALLFGAVFVSLFWAHGRTRALVWPLLGRLRLRALESDRRFQEAKGADANLAAEQAKTNEAASRAKQKADAAARKADNVERERKWLAKELSAKITNQERARRFNERHGLADPRGDDRG